MLSLQHLDAQRWGQLLDGCPGVPLLQRPAYGILKQGHGHRVLRLALLEPGGSLRSGLQLLVSEAAETSQVEAYLPHGPVGGGPEDWRLLLAALPRLLEGRCALLRWEPPWPEGDRQGGRAEDWGFLETATGVQPARTLLHDLQRPEQERLAMMKPVTRRAIRQASERGVRVWEAGPEGLDAFQDLIAATAARHGLLAYPAAYYADSLRCFGAGGGCSAALLLAGDHHEVLAGALMVVGGETASYLHAGSSGRQPTRKASHALVWECMRWARRQGCRWFDFWGVPDAPPAQLEAEVGRRHDGLWGVYRFKRGFGGTLARRVGCWQRTFPSWPPSPARRDQLS